MASRIKYKAFSNKLLPQLYQPNISANGNEEMYDSNLEGKHGHERYGEDGIVFHKDTIILISSMIIMIIVGKYNEMCF